jgi:hypothetical protein
MKGDLTPGIKSLFPSLFAKERALRPLLEATLYSIISLKEKTF